MLFHYTEAITGKAFVSVCVIKVTVIVTLTNNSIAINHLRNIIFSDKSSMAQTN